MSLRCRHRLWSEHNSNPVYGSIWQNTVVCKINLLLFFADMNTMWGFCGSNSIFWPLWCLLTFHVIKNVILESEIKISILFYHLLIQMGHLTFLWRQSYLACRAAEEMTRGHRWNAQCKVRQMNMNQTKTPNTEYNSQHSSICQDVVWVLGCGWER